MEESGGGVFFATYNSTTFDEVDAEYKKQHVIVALYAEKTTSQIKQFFLQQYSKKSQALAYYFYNPNETFRLVLNSSGWSTEDLTTYVPTAGATMTGPLIAQSNTNYTTAQVRNIIMSTSAPTASDGNNGDIWIQYSE